MLTGITISKGAIKEFNNFYKLLDKKNKTVLLDTDNEKLLVGDDEVIAKFDVLLNVKNIGLYRLPEKLLEFLGKVKNDIFLSIYKNDKDDKENYYIQLDGMNFPVERIKTVDGLSEKIYNTCTGIHTQLHEISGKAHVMLDYKQSKFLVENVKNYSKDKKDYVLYNKLNLILLEYEYNSVTFISADGFTLSTVKVKVNERERIDNPMHYTGTFNSSMMKVLLPEKYKHTDVWNIGNMILIFKEYSIYYFPKLDKTFPDYKRVLNPDNTLTKSVPLKLLLNNEQVKEWKEKLKLFKEDKHVILYIDKNDNNKIVSLKNNLPGKDNSHEVDKTVIVPIDNLDIHNSSDKKQFIFNVNPIYLSDMLDGLWNDPLYDTEIFVKHNETCAFINSENILPFQGVIIGMTF